MANDKLNSLMRYAETLKQNLKSPIPLRHKDREVGYKMMLENELRKTESKIASLKDGSK